MGRATGGWAVDVAGGGGWSWTGVDGARYGEAWHIARSLSRVVGVPGRF